MKCTRLAQHRIQIVPFGRCGDLSTSIVGNFFISRHWTACVTLVCGVTLRPYWQWVVMGESEVWKIWKKRRFRSYGMLLSSFTRLYCYVKNRSPKDVPSYRPLISGFWWTIYAAFQKMFIFRNIGIKTWNHLWGTVQDIKDGAVNVFVLMRSLSFGDCGNRADRISAVHWQEWHPEKTSAFPFTQKCVYLPPFFVKDHAWSIMAWGYGSTLS